jgi:heme exporter protein B
MSGRLSLVQAFVFLLRRDLLLALRNRAEYAVPLLFFVLVITLFPLALGALPELLARIAPGIIWVAALLASMLSLDSIFPIRWRYWCWPRSARTGWLPACRC